MKINFFNTLLFSGYLTLLIISCYQLITSSEKSKVYKYLYYFLISTCLTIIMVLLFDFKIVKLHPWIVIFFLPFQYLGPVFFTGFICYYLNKRDLYKKNKIYLYIPFILFFLLYTFLKVNVFLGHPWITKNTVSILHAEVDENSALVFNIIISIWNLLIIKNYENDIGKFSFHHVRQKTLWIKSLVYILLFFNLFWLLTITLFYIRQDISGHVPYYPYWLLYLIFYFAFLHYGRIHIKGKELNTPNIVARQSIDKFQLAGLNFVLEKNQVDSLEENSSDVIAVLSYFATSLFDKNTVDDVLWDIVENCISQLHLEDAIIYTIDKQKKVLVQKAAYGNKNKGQRLILSPLEIKIGEGIVGQVAANGQFMLVNDLSGHKDYIVDDIQRNSELALPIKIDNEIIGVLDSEHSEKNFFTEKHIILFKLITQLVGQKLKQLKTRNTNPITDDNAYFKELNFLMLEGKIFRDSSLSLESISKDLNISSNYLSQLINKISGKNFSDYVNTLRIEDAKIKLKDPKFNHYTILSIGLEAGFNSKSTFYSAFKKHTGLSPKEYRDTT